MYLHIIRAMWEKCTHVFFSGFFLLAALKVRFLSQETHTSKHLPAAERSQPPPATRRLETWHTDQMTDFIKHASEKHFILEFFSLSLSYRVYRTKVRLSGAVLGKAKLCASDQVLSKAPRAETANDGTRVKQHFAEAEQRPGRVSAQALRILLFTPSTLSSPHWAAAYAPVIPSDADLCQIGAGALTQKEKERESERERDSKVLPPSPLLASSNAEGEKRNRSKQRGKQWRADGSSAPHSKSGDRVAVWVGGRDWGESGGWKEEKGCSLCDHNPIPI